MHNNVKCLIDERTLSWGRVGVGARCKDEEVERTMVFLLFLQVSQGLLVTTRFFFIRNLDQHLVLKVS